VPCLSAGYLGENGAVNYHSCVGERLLTDLGEPPEALRWSGRRIPILLHPDAQLSNLATCPAQWEIGVPC